MKKKIIDIFKNRKGAWPVKKKRMNEYFFLIFSIFIWINRNALVTPKNIFQQQFYHGSFNMGSCVLSTAIFQKTLHIS